MSERRSNTRNYPIPPGTAVAQCRENMTVSTMLRGYLGLPKTTIANELATANRLMERDDITGLVYNELTHYQAYLKSIITERHWIERRDELEEEESSDE